MFDEQLSTYFCSVYVLDSGTIIWAWNHSNVFHKGLMKRIKWMAHQAHLVSRHRPISMLYNVLNDTSKFAEKYRVTRQKSDLISGWNICKTPAKYSTLIETGIVYFTIGC
jgi:predicted DNA-binding protein (UPF0278 family)